MSTRDRNDPNYAVTAALEEWTRDWELGKTFLHCRHCGTLQTFHGGGGGQPFPAHKDKCLIGKRGKHFPLYELRAALDTLSPMTP
ncbi:hypothetical protein CGU37_18975 [Pseudomonas fluorescens]|nr:hypothetical protein CGU36_04380 [Pseudomonas fluorescens]OZO47408.1 hypothetical protein CGU37_18975 [Pseudomonas fluorescens]TGY19916.1 hypothetical protein E5845_03775 [Pseudomonas fluorescens]